MKLARRAEITRSTLLWLANLVEAAPDNDGGLYENLAPSDSPESEQETRLAISIIQREADRIRARVKS